MDFLKLLIPLFLAPKNYYEVRQKLGAFVVYEGWLATVILRYDSGVKLFFTKIENALIPTFITKHFDWVNQINPIGLAFGMIVGLLFFIFHVHDRISDVLKIRVRFDRKYIIRPLASAVNLPLDDRQMNLIKAAHDRYMRNLFYKYTSSKADKPLVDRHDVEQALESWSWFWVGLEGAIIWLVGGVVALLIGQDAKPWMFVILLVTYIALMGLIWPFLKRRARAQIEAIADDATARNNIVNAINAI